MFGEGLKVKVNTVLLKLECVHGLNCPGHLVNNAGSGWAGLLDGATAAGSEPHFENKELSFRTVIPLQLQLTIIFTFS